MRAFPILPHLRRSRADGDEAVDPTERGYLFDTDAVTALLRADPDSRLVRHLATIPARSQFISALTYGELIEGARLAPIPQSAILERLQRLSQRVSVLPFDAAAARVLAEIAGRGVAAFTSQALPGAANLPLRDSPGDDSDGAAGSAASPALPLSERDLQVAAIALSNGLILVTGETERFTGVPGLKVANWLSSA